MSAPAATLTKLLAWRPGGYLRASGALFGWLAVRTLAQTALFVLVARTLGADGYGVFITAIAIVGLFSFAAMGATSVLVKEGTRCPERLTELTGDLLRYWACATPVLSLVAVGVCVLLLGKSLPISALTAIALAEIMCATAVDAVGRLYQSQGRLQRMGATFCGLIFFRLVFFLLMTPLAAWTAKRWAWGYFVSSLVFLIVLLLSDRRLLRGFRVSTLPIGALVRHALPFAFYNVAYKAQGELNKPTLAHLAGFQSAGIFSAAHRCIDIVVFPTIALIEAMVPRIYRASHPLRAAAILGLAPFGLTLLGGGLLAGAAGWLPQLLGSSYNSAVLMTQTLAGLPALLVVRVILGVVMSSYNLQDWFLIVHGSGLVALIAFLWILVPAFGALGAVIAAYALEAFLIAAQLVVISKSGIRSSISFVGSGDAV